MPLDGHSYLVSQGWAGSGNGLRQGAIVRPLAIPQKRTLAGLGKDRDEAFPFWDHLFSVAANAIQVKISNDSDDESDSTNNSNVQTSNSTRPTLDRTNTGILSNKPPKLGVPASSSASSSQPTRTNTPTILTTTAATTSTTSSTSVPQYSLLVTAKREAAKRSLYARFFRGPVLGPEDESGGETTTTKPVSEWDYNVMTGMGNRIARKTPMAIAKTKVHERTSVTEEVSVQIMAEEGKKKKRKRGEETDTNGNEGERSTEKKRRKRDKEKKKEKKEKKRNRGKEEAENEKAEMLDEHETPELIHEHKATKAGSGVSSSPDQPADFSKPKGRRHSKDPHPEYESLTSAKDRKKKKKKRHRNNENEETQYHGGDGKKKDKRKKKKRKEAES